MHPDKSHNMNFFSQLCRQKLTSLLKGCSLEGRSSETIFSSGFCVTDRRLPTSTDYSTVVMMKDGCYGFSNTPPPHQIKNYGWKQIYSFKESVPREFRKNSKRPYRDTQELGGNWFIKQFYRRCRWQIYHRCRWYRWRTLTCKYLREFSKNFESILLFRCLGEYDSWKKPEAKISWHCLFNKRPHRHKTQLRHYKCTIYRHKWKR
jgi:hypothetical protein